MHDAGFELLRLSPVTQFADPAIMAEEIEALRADGYRCVTLDCAAWSGEADFHVGIAASLEFPDYYGHNLDALKDCLFGLDTAGARGVVLVFRSWEVFARTAGERAWVVLDVIASASRFRLVYGDRLLALLHVGDAELVFRPVGAVGVVPSQREWRARARAALAQGKGQRAEAEPHGGA